MVLANSLVFMRNIDGKKAPKLHAHKKFNNMMVAPYLIKLNILCAAVVGGGGREYNS